jgi:cellulose-binding protein
VQKTGPSRFPFLLGGIGLFVGALFAGQPPPKANIDNFSGDPRAIVISDIGNEPDDQMSLVRLLLYSNEIGIEGLIASTSSWQKTAVHPETMRALIEAYGKAAQSSEACEGLAFRGGSSKPGLHRAARVRAGRHRARRNVGRGAGNHSSRRPRQRPPTLDLPLGWSEHAGAGAPARALNPARGWRRKVC